jgi:hypothetical protein
LLLFSGTNFLKKQGNNAFNATHVKRISYMGGNDSKYVLTKAAGSLLKYDSSALKKAYKLTYGQPLLLQSLGANIIEEFNNTILTGLKRSNYVSEHDMDAAIKKLIREPSTLVFSQFWDDTNTDDHYFLSALALATKRSKFLGLKSDDIKNILEEKQLNFSNEKIFEIVERFLDEEILIRQEGQEYRIAIPLYRDWINWHWPIERIKAHLRNN